MAHRHKFSLLVHLFFFFFLGSHIFLIPLVDCHRYEGNVRLQDSSDSHPLLSDPDATYESLRNILEGSIENYPSEGKAEDEKRSESRARSRTRHVNSTDVSTLWSSTANATVMSSSTTKVIETTTTTERDYYCLLPGIPSDVMLIPTIDQTWQVDAAHTVTCFTDPASGFTSNDIHLRMGWQLPPIPHQVVDDYTITATLNETDPGSYKLMCMTYTSPPKMCTRSVKVGYPPLDVENLVCVSWSLRVLECNWTVPENPAQLPSEDYRTYLVTGFNKKIECHCDGGEGKCGTASEGCMSTCCSWRPSDYPQAEEYLTIRFEVSNALGSDVFEHTIDNWASVIPDPAEKIILTTFNGTLFVRVDWDMPLYIGTLAHATGIRYAVEYRPHPSIYGIDTWHLGRTDICHSNSCESTVEVDHPGAEYQFRVRLRAMRSDFTLDDDGWWSQWNPVQSLIPPQRPWKPPSVGVGTFQKESGTSILKAVTVSWNPLSPLDFNGPDFRYVVNATLDGQPLPYSHLSDTYVIYNNISDDSRIRVNIVSSNSVGQSETSSQVNVSPALLMPSLPVLPVVIYHEETDVFELRWGNKMEGQNYYTVYVCNDGLDTKDPCMDNLYWKDVGNVTSVNVTLLDLGLEGATIKDIRFAVSNETSTGNISSGMSWDKCYHPQKYRQTTAPPTVLSSISTTSTTAEVSWDLDCEDRSGAVEAVFAEWCQDSHNFSSCETLGSKNETDIFSGRIVLTGLKPATNYYVRLRLQYREKASVWSTYRDFSTTSGVVNPGMPTWLIITIAVGSVFVAASSVLCVSYSRGKIKQFFIIYRKPIKVPTGIADVIAVNPDYSSPSANSYTGSLASLKSTSNQVEETAAVNSGTRLVEGNKGSAEGPNRLKEYEEDERLLQRMNSPRSSPQSSRNLPLLQNSNGYVQSDSFTDRFENASTGASGSDTIPLAQLSKGYMAIDTLRMPWESSNGYVLQESMHTAELQDLKGMKRMGKKSGHELPEMGLPSPGYVTALSYRIISDEGQGSSTSDLIGRSTPGASSMQVDSGNSAPLNAVSPGYTAIQDPDFGSAGRAQGYVAVDSINTGDFSLEVPQQLSSYLKLTSGAQQIASRSDALEAPRTLGNIENEHLETSDKEVDRNITSLTDITVPDFTASQVQSRTNIGRGNGYVALDAMQMNNLPPELQQQLSQDSGFMEVQEYCSSDTSIYPAFSKHTEGENSQVSVPSNAISNSENDSPTTVAPGTVKNNGYIEHPFSHKDNLDHPTTSSDENPGKMLMLIDEDTRMKSFEGIPALGYISVNGLSSGKILIKEDTSETEGLGGEILKIDPELIKSLSVENGQLECDRDNNPKTQSGGYVKDFKLQEHMNQTLNTPKQTVTAAYVLSPEIKSQPLNAVPPSGRSVISDEIVCNTTDLGESKIVIRDTSNKSINVMKPYFSIAEAKKNDNQKYVSLASDPPPLTLNNGGDTSDGLLLNDVDLGDPKKIFNNESELNAVMLKPLANGIQKLTTQETPRYVTIGNGLPPGYCRVGEAQM